MCSNKEMDVFADLIRAKLAPLKVKACKGPLTDKEYAIIHVYDNLITDLEVAKTLYMKKSNKNIVKEVDSLSLLKKRVI